MTKAVFHGLSSKVIVSSSQPFLAMVFTYDADKLTYVSVDVPDSNCSVDAATAGRVHVQAYGEAKNLGEAFTLNFTVKTTATGAATVTATSAKIDKSANAVAKDAPEAKLLDAETMLTIKAVHSVTLPNIFEGKTTVEDGADYTFSRRIRTRATTNTPTSRRR